MLISDRNDLLDDRTLDPNTAMSQDYRSYSWWALWCTALFALAGVGGFAGMLFITYRAIHTWLYWRGFRSYDVYLLLFLLSNFSGSALFIAGGWQFRRQTRALRRALRPEEPEEQRWLNAVREGHSAWRCWALGLLLTTLAWGALLGYQGYLELKRYLF